MSDSTEINNETDDVPLVPKKVGLVDKAKKYIENNSKLILGLIVVLVLIIIVLTVVYLSTTGKINIPYLSSKSPKDESDEESEDESE